MSRFGSNQGGSIRPATPAAAVAACLALLAALALPAQPAPAQPAPARQAPVLKPLEGAGFADWIDSRAAVSGSGVSGAMLVGPVKPVERRALWIRCLSDCSGRIQILAKSADVAWQGSGLFEGAELPPNRWIRVPMAGPASELAAKKRSGLPDELLTVMARRVNERNAGIGPALLIAGWSADERSEPQGDMVQLAVTARQRVAARAAGSPAIPCRRIDEPQPRGFTHVCRVPLAALSRDSRILLEQDDGGSLQSVPVPLG